MLPPSVMSIEEVVLHLAVARGRRLKPVGNGLYTGLALMSGSLFDLRRLMCRMKGLRNVDGYFRSQCLKCFESLKREW